MAFKKTSLIAVASSIALLGALVLSGCGAAGGGGVAATVNGTEISEDKITDYIQDFRAASDLSDDAAWSEWMAENAQTPESLREMVANFFIEDELEKHLAKELEVEVEQSAIGEQVAAIRANYSSDADWENALKAQGYANEQAYRDELYMSILEQNLAVAAITDDDVKVTNKDILRVLDVYGESYDGMRRSSHILFAADDKETAQKVLDDLKAGKISFEDAAKQYSTDTGSAENGGDVGWDGLSSFVTEYADALSKLKVGQMSGLVESQYGFHIIKCTDKFKNPAKANNIKDYPEALVNQIKEYLTAQKKEEAYNAWFEEQMEKAEIVINDMPENLPYNVVAKDDTDGDDEGAANGSDDDADDEPSDVDANEDSK